MFARLAIDLGAQSIVNTAHKMGIPKSVELAPYPSITLGVSPVSPLWMTAAYSTLAANGVRHDPAVRDQGRQHRRRPHASRRYKSKGRRVLTDGVAYEANKVLEGPICCGTAAATAQFSDGRVEAGKTGTTNDYKDAWFCGYTPNLTTCVWMGYPKGEITLGYLNGHTPYGGDIPATIWRTYMERAFALRAEEVPAGVRLAAAQATRCSGCRSTRSSRPTCPAPSTVAAAPVRPAPAAAAAVPAPAAATATAAATVAATAVETAAVGAAPAPERLPSADAVGGRGAGHDPPLEPGSARLAAAALGGAAGAGAAGRRERGR